MAERAGSRRWRGRDVGLLVAIALATTTTTACAAGGGATAGAPSTTPTSTPASTAAPSSTRAPSPPTTPSGGGPTVPDDADGPYAVVDVVDGDTIKVEVDGERVTVRVLGIDTPETRAPGTPVQCFGREATARAEALLDGQQVRLTTDPTQDRYDRYDRLLAYVWLADGSLFEWAMVADGFAHEYTYDLPYRYQVELREAERSAREAGRGLWASATCAGDTTVAAA